jgi:hypothetical protein
VVGEIMAKNEDVKFEIIQHFGVMKERKNGWKKELNKVKWGDNDPKWDIREWNEEHDKMSRGITLSDEEAKILFEIFNSIFC